MARISKENLNLQESRFKALLNANASKLEMKEDLGISNTRMDQLLLHAYSNKWPEIQQWSPKETLLETKKLPAELRHELGDAKLYSYTKNSNGTLTLTPKMLGTTNIDSEPSDSNTTRHAISSGAPMLALEQSTEQSTKITEESFFD